MPTHLVREHYKMPEEGLWTAAVSSWEVVWGCCLERERNCGSWMWEGHLDVLAGLISDREERLVDKWLCSCRAVLAAAWLCAHGVSQLLATIKPFFVVLTCAGTNAVSQPPFCICITWACPFRGLAGAATAPSAQCQLIAFGCSVREMAVSRELHVGAGS